MTVRTNALQICDRCQKPFAEKHLKAGEAVPVFKQQGLVVTSTSGSSQDSEPKFTLLFSFDDICGDCHTVVTNLLAKIRLDAPQVRPAVAVDGQKIAKRRPRKPKPAVDDTPKVEEYSEGSEGSEGSPELGKESLVDDAVSEPEKGEDVVGPEASSVESVPEANSKGGNGAATEGLEGAVEREPGADDDDDDGSSEDVQLVTDPETGDRYNPHTGEVVSRGAGAAGGKHPF